MVLFCAKDDSLNKILKERIHFRTGGKDAWGVSMYVSCTAVRIAVVIGGWKQEKSGWEDGWGKRCVGWGGNGVGRMTKGTRLDKGGDKAYI